MVQGIDADAVGALRHRGDAEVRAVGDERGEEQGVRVLGSWALVAGRDELVGEVARGVHLDEQVLDADAREARLDHAT